MGIILSTAYSFNEPSNDHSSLSWFVTLLIFIVPPIQGFVDCLVFFESRIVYRRKGSRSGTDRSANDHRHASRRTSHSRSQVRERSDFVFENFSVPFGAGPGSEEMESVLESRSGDSVNIGSEFEDDLNDVDLDSLDGNQSDREASNARRRNDGGLIVEHLRGDDFHTDVDDYGVEFRSLGKSAELSSILSDPNTTPMKSASDPIDLISF